MHLLTNVGLVCSQLLIRPHQRYERPHCRHRYGGTAICMFPGKTMAPLKIAPSVWTSKKPKVVPSASTTPVAICTKLKWTEDTLSQTLTSEFQKITTHHEQQLRAMEENHCSAMDAMVKKFDVLMFHTRHQCNLINNHLMCNDNNQQQLTRG